MGKQLLVTNIDDFLIKHLAFVEPHKAWFDRVIKKTGDKSLRKWKNKKDYFIGVNQAMEQLMPNASKSARTAQARKWYQSDVVSYIKSHPSYINKSRVNKLKKLRSKYQIILLTTNTTSYIGKILRAGKLTGIYHGIIASNTEQEPNKANLFRELIKKYGKPDYYLTTKAEPDIVSKFRKSGARIISPSKLESL